MTASSNCDSVLPFKCLQVASDITSSLRNVMKGRHLTHISLEESTLVNNDEF